MKKIFLAVLFATCFLAVACNSPNNTDDTINNKDDRTDRGGNNQNEGNYYNDTARANHRWQGDTTQQDKRDSNRIDIR